MFRPKPHPLFILFTLLLASSSFVTGQQEAQPYDTLVVNHYLTQADSAFETGAYEQAIKIYQDLDRIYLAHPNATQKERAKLAKELAAAQIQANNYREAIQCLNEALPLQRSAFGDSSKLIADSYFLLGTSFRFTGELDSATIAHSKALEIWRAQYGYQHEKVAMSIQELGVLQSLTSNYDSAQTLLKEALTIQLSIGNDSTEATAMMYNTLGVINNNLGNRKLSINYHNQALELRRHLFGELSEEVAASYDNIGVVYQKLRQIPEALEYKLRALKLNEQLFGVDHPQTAISYNNIGSALSALERYDEAISYARKAIEIYRQKFGHDHIHLINFYDNLSNRYRDKGLLDSALTASHQALEIRKSIYGLEDQSVQSGYLNIGNSLDKLQRFEEALQTKEKVFQVALESGGPKNPYLVKVYQSISNTYRLQQDFKRSNEILQLAIDLNKTINGPEPNIQLAILYDLLSNNYYQIGEYELSKEIAKKSTEIFKNYIPPNHPVFAVTFNRIGLNLKEQGLYKESLIYLNRSLEIKKAQKYIAPGNIVDSYINIGIVHERLGDIHKGIKFQFKALSILESADESPKKNNRIKAIYTNLGVDYDKLGNTSESIRFFKKALELSQQLYGTQHLETAAAHNNLGVSYNNTKQYTEAIKQHQKALKIRAEISGLEGIDNGNSLQNLYVSYAKLGHYDTARIYAERALNTRIKYHGAIHPDVGVSLRSLGELYDKEGKIDSVITYYDRSLRAFNYYPGSSFDDIYATPDLINTLSLLGKAHLNCYKSNLNKTDLYDAQERLEAATKLLRQLAKTNSAFTNSQLPSIEKQVVDYYIQVEKVLSEIIPTAHSLEDAFQVAEKSKAYQLLQAFQATNARTFAKVPDTIIQHETKLQTAINRLEQNRLDLLVDSTSLLDSSLIALNAKLFDLTTSQDSLQTLIREHYPDYYRLKYEFSSSNISQIQAVLDTNQSIIEYVLGDSVIHLFVIDASNCKLITLPKPDSLISTIFQLRNALSSPYQSGESEFKNDTEAAERYVASASKLYDQLVRPVENLLKERVLIIPDRELGHLPFQALISESSNRAFRFQQHTYFGITHRISYSYSATLWQQMCDRTQRPKPHKTVLAMAPYFDGTPYLLDSIYREELQVSQLDSPLTPVINRQTLTPLPYSGEEAYNIAKIWDGVYFQDSSATKPTFLENASDFKILHLATHGLASDQVGEYAYLAFTEIPDSLENEQLFVKEIYSLSLNSDLVVLSACETGTGKVSAGEGVMSLARSFAYAGAKSIVTTHWSVDDLASKNLMINFHQNLRQGQAKDVALWNAQKKHLKEHDGLSASPYFWAGFFGIGDMRPLGN